MCEQEHISRTGDSGLGKTTVLVRTVGALKAKDYAVGGMTTCEMRQGSMRIGFKVLDLVSARKEWLAQTGRRGGPRVAVNTRLICEDSKK